MSNAIKLILLTALICACGDENVDLNGDGGTNNGTPDAAGAGVDARVPANCVPGETQCSNCLDDDNDGQADMFDVHCTAPEDNREDSFATGLPGDNIDVAKQDCFFDGDSGAGNDGCDMHVCCLLDAPTQADCPAEFKPQQYDPADCTLDPNDPQDAQCIAECGAATPPGCDCFGCCTICDGTNCVDVLTHPAVSPNCDIDVLNDPTQCVPCTKRVECSTECDNANCILCPGQTPDDLPASCNGNNECPVGVTVCDSQDDCGDNQYCSVGCCVTRVE